MQKSVLIRRQLKFIDNILKKKVRDMRMHSNSTIIREKGQYLDKQGGKQLFENEKVKE